MRTLRIATRASRLAMVQCGLVAEALRAAMPGLNIEIINISTQGDRNRQSPLWKIERTGFFTSELERALLEGRADVAVHSYKDLPTQPAEGLRISAVFERKHPEDVLVSSKPIRSLEELTKGVVVGTSSPRRMAQVKHIRPDLKTEPIRGNVETRIRKAEEGQVDAVILARAGLERLGLQDRIRFTFDPSMFVPAPAQGALAIQTRDQDTDIIELVRQVHDEKTAHAAAIERTVLAGLHPGCHAPVGVFAELNDRMVRLVAMVADVSGMPYIKKELSGAVDESTRLADEMISRLLSDGAETIIRDAETT